MNTATTPTLDHVDLIADGWVKKYHLYYTMPDGTPHDYDSASRKGPKAYEEALTRNALQETPIPDAVCIVPILEDGSVLCIREFRYPLNSWCIAFPAGLIDEGETIVQCIKRELHEEVGFQPIASLGDAAIHYLAQTGFSSAGLTEENVQMVFVQVEPAGERALQKGELIEPFIVPRDEILTFLRENHTPMETRTQLSLEMLGRLPRFEIDGIYM